MAFGLKAFLMVAAGSIVLLPSIASAQSELAGPPGPPERPIADAAVAEKENDAASYVFEHFGALSDSGAATGNNGFSGAFADNPFDIGAPGIIAATGFAAAQVTATQITAGSSARLAGSHTVELKNSFIGASGIVGVNQESGAGSSQANVAAIASAPAASGALALVSTAQTLVGNRATVSGTELAVSIDNSFNNASGLVGVNQSAGAFNQQINAIAIAISAGGSDAAPMALIGDHDLASVTTKSDNEIVGAPARQRTTQISNSFNDFIGVAQVTQTAGSLNQVTNAIAVTVTTLGGS
jgi:hypothetical protein